MTGSRMRTAAWRTLLLALAVTTAAGPGLGPDPWSGSGAAFAQDDDGGDDGGDRGDDRGDNAGGDDGAAAGSDDGAAAGGGSANDDAGDDGGDDADDGATDDGATDDGASGRAPTTRRAPAGSTTRVRSPAPVPVQRPVFAPGEIVVTNLGDADLATLLAEGFTVIERVDLSDVAVVLHRLQAPGPLTLDQARDRVRAQPTGATGDFNHFYRSEEDSLNPASAPSSAPGPLPPAPPAQPIALSPTLPCAHLNCAALSLIGWPAARDAAPQCRVTVPVGVIDTGVNADHENLREADIEVLRLVAEQVDASKAVHGTAVAALLVGQRSDRAPGLIPEARLIVVDIFGRDGGDERASVASLVKALDLLARRGVKVINLSLAGPPNVALEAALIQVTGPGGAVVLAAAGNGGPGAGVAYPAGYPSVLAVTAVDQRGQIYRRAQRGFHVDLAAPGVDVWSATSISGVKPKTGTSFAVPFASAVAAVLASRDPAATPDMLAARMRGLVRDIGASGPDEVFGAGLLALDTLCQPQIVAPPME